MEVINNKVSYLKAKADVLEYVINNADAYEELLNKFEPNTVSHKMYKATLLAWRRLAAELAAEF